MHNECDVLRPIFINKSSSPVFFLPVSWTLSFSFVFRFLLRVYRCLPCFTSDKNQVAALGFIDLDFGQIRGGKVAIFVAHAISDGST